MFDNDIETLDFNEPSNNENVETIELDINNDNSDNNEDEKLDFVDDIKEEKSKTSIKDFYIKSPKVKKIVKKSLIYTIILMLLGFEIFISKSGNTLNKIKVYASDNNPIRIVQNEKYGYIDYHGNKIISPKYTYAEKFIDGYAIVKNTSNESIIIDRGGKDIIKSGTYFSMYRAKNNIVASKLTKNGLKYGILNSNLRKITDFKYDNISYKDGVFTYKIDNTVGLINESGKDIFKYKLTDKDEKKIEVELSNITNEDYQKYGVVTVNHTSLIINLKNGKVVTDATLNKIVPEENNIFYELLNNNVKRYMYVKDSKVVLESENYNSMSIDSIETGVIKAINMKYTYEYISTKTMEQLSKDIGKEDVYYGDKVVVYKSYNYKKNELTLNFVKDGEVYNTLTPDFDIERPFNHGLAVIRYNDNTFGYIDENGHVINDEKYIEANDFDSYGDAIVKTSNGYGVIKKDGSTLIKCKNEEIIMAKDTMKINYSKAKVYYAVKNNNEYILYNKHGRKVSNNTYDTIEFNDKYPVLKASNSENDMLITTIEMNEINITSFKTSYDAYENYLILKNEYYNYKGKLIYVDNRKDKKSE